MARDCLHFVIQFFEPIKLSATHIYHSALELCPTSTIVRKLYYEECNRIACLPRVVIGTPDSWNKAVSVSIEDRNLDNCAWSPCSQFIAVQTRNVIDIRSQLTLDLSTTLQPTETHIYLAGRPAYSPDGCFLACSSDGSILIWDIQTGGVVREIECDFYPTSLAWSLDGRMVGVIKSEAGQADVITYGVASGRTLFTGSLYSEDYSYLFMHLWAYKGTFLVAATQKNNPPRVNIFEVQHVLINIHSLSLVAHSDPNISFSPATCRIALSDHNVLRIFENWNSTCILEETGKFSHHKFSSDGSLFAASEDFDFDVHIWKYGSCRFLPWKKFPFMGIWYPLQFSPNLLSIMQRSTSALNVWRLHDLPPHPTTNRSPQVGLTRSGQIVQASGNFITIVNPHSRPALVPVVDAGAEIEVFVLMGNVLLVTVERDIIAWLVPPAGFADDPLGHRPANRRDALWTVQEPGSWIGIASEVGFIDTHSRSHTHYHTETGEVLNLDHYSLKNVHQVILTNYLCGKDYLHFHNLPRTNDPLADGWQTSRGGWVKDSEGRCRLWLPVDWRGDWRAKDWRDDTTTQFSIIGGKVVIVKF